MRLSTIQALAYLKGVGHEMSERTLRRIKAELKHNEMQRLHFIAAIGFESQHLERIDNCELILKLMWENYHLERSPSKKVQILKEIKELQPYISTYYEATKEVIKPAGQEDTSISEDTTTVPTEQWI